MITGAAAGIGRAFCLLLADRGYRICALDLDPSGLDRLAADLGGRLLAREAGDVSDPERVAAAFAACHEAAGRIDLVVASAGVAFSEPSRKVAPEGWRRVLAVDLDGAFRCARAATRHMRATGGGVSVHVRPGRRAGPPTARRRAGS